MQPHSRQGLINRGDCCEGRDGYHMSSYKGPRGPIPGKQCFDAVCQGFSHSATASTALEAR